MVFGKLGGAINEEHKSTTTIIQLLFQNLIKEQEIYFIGGRKIKNVRSNRDEIIKKLVK